MSKLLEEARKTQQQIEDQRKKKRRKEKLERELSAKLDEYEERFAKVVSAFEGCKIITTSGTDYPLGKQISISTNELLGNDKQTKFRFESGVGSLLNVDLVTLSGKEVGLETETCPQPAAKLYPKNKMYKPRDLQVLADGTNLFENSTYEHVHEAARRIFHMLVPSMRPEDAKQFADKHEWTNLEI
jgi:hypothetical protein